jgi:hypothetical protein
MRNWLLALFLTLGIALAGFSAVPAAPLGAGPGQTQPGVSVLKAQYAGYCERLRRACIYKVERGEVGQGNCHRYRVECGQQRHCEKLRQACVYKEERGEVGQGNCRRYRHECGAW